MNYAFLRAKLTSLIGEWLEEERLKAPEAVLSFTPLGPPIENAADIETVSTEAFEQEPVVELDEETVAPNLPLASEDLASELSSRVTIVKSLINLEEEPIATDVKKELEVTVDLTAIRITSL